MQNDCFPDAILEWDRQPFSTIATINPSYPIVKGRNYPFVEMAAVGENFGGIQSFEWRKLEGSGLSRFKANDTLFAKITPCPENGKIALVESLPEEVGLGSTEFIVLSPLENCNPKFLFYMLCSHAVKGRAVARMEGSTGRQRIPEDVFKRRLLIPLPPPEEQAAIARILDAVDTLIVRTREAVDRARDLKKSLVQQLFTFGAHGESQQKTAIGMIPKSWKVVPVSSVVTQFQYGLSLPMHLKGEYPILRMGNIQDGDVLLNDLKYVDLPKQLAEFYLVRKGDVLFNRTNSQEHVGKVGIYRNE